MKNIIPILLLLVMVVGGLIGLQVFLSTRKNKWFGLILPILCVLLSIVPVLSQVAFETKVTTRVTSYAEDGTIIEDKVKEEPYTNAKNREAVIWTSIIIFGVYNIPTGIYLVIYFCGRQKLKKKERLEHMQIQDLE